MRHRELPLSRQRLVPLGLPGLLFAVWLLPAAIAQSQADGDREQQVMERFLAVLERAPRRGTALDRVYGYHVERGTLDALIKTYDDRVAKDPHDGASWLLLGLFEAQRGRDGAAVVALRRAEQERKDEALPAFYLAQELVLLGQPDEAAQALERAIERRPARNDLLEIFQALGRIHQRAHHNDQALAVWTRLEQLFPEDARVQEQIASALSEESQLEPALVRYEALARTSRDPYRRVLFRLEAADLKVRLGRRPDALRDLEGLVGSLEPESWLAREVRRRVEDVFLRNDDHAGLAAYYERWLKTAPDDVEAMSRLGRTLAVQGRTAEARSWLDRAVKLAPTRKELRLALIDQLVHERKFAEAAAQYEAINRSEPSNPDVVRDWGRVVLRDTSRPEPERKQAAAAVWNRLLESRPRDPAIAAQVADLFRQAGFIEEAIALYEKAVALAPEAPQYREYLGEYLHILKRSGDALAAWRAIAAGPNRTARNLARLGEILAGFGYKDEAIAAIADACTLDTESFELWLKHADLLLGLRRFEAATGPLAAAERLAADDDQREAVLIRQIAVDQGANRLPARIESLMKEVAGERAGDASAWRRLARYREAARQGTEAIAAIEKAIALDEESVPSWVAAARLYEAGGRLADAAAVNRRLATADRRARTVYLTAVARLEVRLGRRDEALQAGRDLLAAAPGNPEQIEFFANLCFQLGANDEGLEVLRRAVRGNETDPDALRGLAEALAREFRTGEAIELYWRAFDQTRDLDTKLGVVSRLTELYLQRNQLDRLLDRLERYQAEAAHEREGTLCLAQAHAAAGDFGTARQQLESLLVASPRDTALLKQLSELAESEGDFAVATRYQKRLNELAPSHDAARRLVQLALRGDEFEEAEAVWAQAMDGDQEPSFVLQALDDLLAAGKNEAVAATTRRLLIKDPNNWELLYREGMALLPVEGPTAAGRRFQTILDLRHDEDEVSTIIKARRKAKPGPAAAGAGGSTRSALALIERVGIRHRTAAVRTLRGILGLDPVYARALSGSSWFPPDFGTARMAALGFLIAQGEHENAMEAWLARTRPIREQAPHDPRPFWDDFYVALLLEDGPKAYETARDLARVAPNDASACYALLYAVYLEGTGNRNRLMRADEAEARAPLPPEVAALLRDAFVSVVRSNPGWAANALAETVLAELARAGRAGDLDGVYGDLVANPTDLSTIAIASTIAAHRGDFDNLRKLFEAFNRLPPGTRSTVVPTQSYYLVTPAGISPVPAYYMASALWRKTGVSGRAEILKLVDDYTTAIQSPALVAERSRMAKKSSALPPRQVYPTFLSSGTSPLLTTEYPLPGAYLDSGAILLLRNVFERFKRDDLLSDLLAHVARRADAAAGDAGLEVYYRLEQSALLWWANEKDAALRALERAGKLVPGDAELKLTLAELQAQRGELAAAFDAVESVEVVDQDLTRRRELLALRLSVQTGKVERARQAAERLFGLRLDSSTQVLLAAQMQQLGMNELAEAILGRARRRAGNNAEALVGLMTQYQRQGNTDAAVQIAHRVLRSTGAGSSAPGTTDFDSPAQRQAIQVLVGSGKLSEIILRLETQLQQSPDSLRLHQSLAAYYRAAGQRDKLRAITEAMIKVRPDDGRIRVQAAAELARSGDVTAALGHIQVALKKDPRLFARHRSEIFNVFSRQKKIGALLTLMEEIGLRALNDPVAQSAMVLGLLQDPATFEEGWTHWRKMWDAFTGAQERLLLLTDLCAVEAVWKQPELYDDVRQVIIPGAAVTRADAWLAFDDRAVGRVSPDGRRLNLAIRLLESAAGSGRLEQLARNIEDTLRRLPHWLGGKTLLGLVRVRQGRMEEGKRILAPIIEDSAVTPPLVSLLILGQELRDVAPFGALARTVYERAIKVDDTRRYSSVFEYGPVKYLAILLHKDGRTAEARSLLLHETGEVRNRPSTGSAGASSYRKISNLVGIATVLLELGCPSDALSLYAEVLGATTDIEEARLYEVNTLLQQAREGVDRALHGLTPETLATTLRSMVQPAGAAKEKGERPVDLLLVVHPRALDHAVVTSLMPQALTMALAQRQRLSELKADLAAARHAHPDDLVAETAEVLVECASDDPAAIAESAARLERRVAGLSLESLSDGTRPNARQRADAAQRLGLWLVARACWKHDATRAVGDRVAAVALEGARRQADNAWTLAMLREWGQQANDRGDRATAESRWGAMLDLVLASGAVPQAPPPAPQPAARAARGAGRGRAGRDETPAATPERFEQAADIARLAARDGHFELSLRAVRDALRGGPPVVAMPISPTAARVALVASSTRALAMAAPEQSALDRLTELEKLWRDGSVSPAVVYDTLRDVVLPPMRPAEVFLYNAPLAAINRSPVATRLIPPPPRNAAAMLARWAVAAGRSDELRERISLRQAQPAAELKTLVLLSLLTQAEQRPEAVARSFEAIVQKLQKDSLQSSAELACHAALPVLSAAEPATARAAVAVIERAVRVMASGTEEEPVDTLLLALARFHFEHASQTEAIRCINEALAAAEHGTPRTVIDDPFYRLKHFYAGAAHEYLRAFRDGEALDLLGQFADAPIARSGDPPLGGPLGALESRVAAWPSPARYSRLRAWSFVTTTRTSIRLLAGFVPESPPQTFHQMADTASLLIDAARAAGKLDELGAELEELDRKGADNARPLMILVAIARGHGGAVAPLAQAVAADVPRKWPEKPPLVLAIVNPVTAPPPGWWDILVARACLADPALRSIGEAMACDLITHAERARAKEFEGLLRHVLDVAKGDRP